VERLEATEDGLVEVSGRWFGVRGRRFVRPALTLTLGDAPQQRWLADLAHKPWAALDGEPWMAAFPVDVELADATAIELTVAPDIEIMLRAPEGATGTAAAGPVAAHARSPVAKQDARGRRPSARAQDLERLTTRLASAQAALERERERRAAVDQALEEQRTEGRRIAAELGRVRAELDLASTVQRENEAVSAELDSTRRQLRAAERRYEELSAEHDRALEAQARVEAELRERSGALESARDALEQERAAGAERLRSAEASAERLRATEARAGRQRATEARATEQPQTSVSQRRSATVSETNDRSDDPEPTREEPRRRERRAERDLGYDRGNDVRPRPVAAHRGERPVNPALRSRPNWVWRVLALLVIVAVVVAVWIVLHSTILH
jgi:hypothetical protein